MPRSFSWCLLGLLSLWMPVALPAQDLPSIAEKTAGFEKQDGFFPIYWDARQGKIWLEIPRFGEDAAFLYVHSLPAGLGSNDVGLDRGQLGEERVVYFERVGPKVLLVRPNLRYRAVSDDEAERRAVRDAFAEGVEWGFTVAAETDGRVLVDATDFVVRDVHRIADRLRQTNQGSFRLDAGRSAPYLPMTKAFPQNTEMEARLTFVSDNPGRYVRDVAADPYAVTLRVRHSFVQLPGPGYEPRAFDPRAGYFGLSYGSGVAYVDYARPIPEDKEVRVISRHRLACAGPRGADGLCDPVEPIVYYLDPGTPEPVRSALLDGARWWNDAFTAAGYRDAFRVEVLPDTADMMDVRYNVIQWVHRATRGWSYGSSVVDPRTGEIIKGHVTLGSLRVRQDYLLFEGLLAPYTGPHADGLPDPAADPMLQTALARLRQLSAHEVGHTLGLVHNFAASFNDRASVMDYPAPLVTVDADGQIDLSDAYDTGIGAWDEIAIRYGYTDLADTTDEAAALEAILREGREQGLLFITDADARPPGGAHPVAHLWDNGTNAVEALRQEMQVRRVALNRFGLANIRTGEPLATLEEVLVPLYLRHRYQAEAAAKLVGGVSYTYALRGDAQPVPTAVPGDLQRTAVDALLQAITPDQLALPQNIRTQIPPRPPGYSQNRELFDGYSGLVFDPYAPAETVASLILGLLVHPERAARLVYQHDADADLPGLSETLTRISATVWEAPIPADPYAAELQRLVQQVWTDVLIETAARPDAAPAVKSRITQHLRALQEWLTENPGPRRDLETQAHRLYVFDQVDRYLLRLYRPDERRTGPTTPPGSPIGQDDEGVFLRQERRRAWLDRWTPAWSWCGH
ncbi:hypothetical protein AWN76_015895 [Rhodothermaceae bacterium RA]|nr:hypothetical protein AWN76_015895 [Rhodothermaceae bacterium RA]